jgi:O-antigen/teichoic acid export membrane protein
MGIIIRQSIIGSFWSYFGVIIGFVTNSYLFPNYLAPDAIGLLGLLLAWSILFAQFSALGFHGVTSRLFPYFRNRENGHNGFLFIAFIVMIVGFVLFLLVFIFVKSWLVESNLEKSKLFSEYFYLLIPLTFFTILFTFLDVFNKVLYDAVLGTFLQEFLQRVLIFLVALLFSFGVIDLHEFILAYVASVCVKSIVIFVFLLYKGEISLRPRLSFLDKNIRKEMVDVALFGVLSGVGVNIVFNIDKIIINQILGLGPTGIYTIAFFFGTLVIIPSRPLLRITGTLVADAWKHNNVKYISDIYKRSCLNQFVIAALLFGGIWINIDNILVILGPEYASGKWVIFFVAFGYLIDMGTGANGVIISYSKHYRVDFWFLTVLIVVVITSMYLFIPIWGITGAAVAIAISFLVNNLMRFIFLYRKYQMQPFNYKFLLILLSLGIAYYIAGFLPKMLLVSDILIRSIIFSGLFGLLVYLFKVSDDIILLKDKLRNKFFII